MLNAVGAVELVSGIFSFVVGMIAKIYVETVHALYDLMLSICLEVGRMIGKGVDITVSERS